MPIAMAKSLYDRYRRQLDDGSFSYTETAIGIPRKVESVRAVS